MAGGKETPRQKMVGLMYLVLMALLAMNVSKDILDSFLIINEGLEQSTQGLDYSTKDIYTTLKLKNSVNPEKVGPFWKQAQEVQKRADHLIHHIDSIKKKIVAATEKIELAVADTLDPHDINAKDNYDVPTFMLVGEKEDGSEGLAAAIRSGLHDFSEYLFASSLFSATDPKPFSIYDTSNYQGNSWEIHNFYHAPLMASVSILSKLENDVRAAEFKAINRLSTKINSGVIPFDTLGAQAIAESNYVVRGDSFSTHIFLGAFNKTLQPTVIVGELDEQGRLIQAYDTITAVGGMARYKARASEIGEHECNGVIQMTDDEGQASEFPFRSKYQVFQPSAVVSADKMNVMYIGPDNPVSVSVPGYSDADTKVSISGGNALIKQGDGKYVAKLRETSPRNIQVSVQVKSASDEWVSMGGQEFRVKKMPDPYVTIAGKKGNQKMSCNKLRVQPQIKAEYDPNFMFQLPVNVESYKIEFIMKGDLLTPPVSVNGKLVPDRIKTLIAEGCSKRKLKAVLITDIVAKNLINQVYRPESVMVEVF